jgi:hypothetical protein
MHTINPGTESKYKIVQCEDPLCNICTSTVFDGYGMPPSPQSQGIVVYTCSNPSCSLCDGDYSLLLDIIHPTLSPEEDWALMQEQTNRHMTSSLKRDNETQETKIENTRLAKRKLPGHIGRGAKLRRQSINDDVINRSDHVINKSDHEINRSEDLYNSVDDNQLMSLAMELELDKIHCLPDLQKDLIIELTI